MPPQELHEESNSEDPRSTTSEVEKSVLLSKDHVAYNTMEQLDPHQMVRRPSTFRRRSFLMEFVEMEGPKQIVTLVLLLALGFGSTIGVVPAVMTDRYARLNHGYSDPTNCADWSTKDKPFECLAGSGDAQNGAAYENLISNVLTFITSSMMGSISDEHGRRGIIITGLTLSFMRPIILVIMQLVPSMSPTWYYGVGTLSGLINWIAIALSALADVLPPKWRAAGFGLLLAGFSLGFALSPILATIFNHFQVSVVAATVLTIAWVHTVLFLPETLPAATSAAAKLVRQEEARRYTTTRGRMLHALCRPVREISILNRNNFFRLLSALAFFSGMVQTADQTLLIYYVEERLAFNDHDVAIMFMLSGILGILVQGVLIKPFNECFGERRVIMIAFLLGALDNFMYGVASNKATIFGAICVSSFVGMSFPTISAIKANNVEESEQGRIQGALYSLQALAAGVGPMLLRWVYHYTKDTKLPGAMFIFAGVLYIVASVFACALPQDKADSRGRATETNDNTDDHAETASVEEETIETPLL